MVSKNLELNHIAFTVDTDLNNIVELAGGNILLLEGEISENKNYIHDMGNYIMYISDRNVLVPQQKNMKLMFKKHKIYSIRKRNRVQDIVTCKDEFGTEFNIMDIWWETFYFLTEEDLLKFERKLKIENINENNSR